MEKNILDKYYEICKSLPVVDYVENLGNYLKIGTNILFEKADAYLNLYIIPEEDYVCLSDSNNVYGFCDDYYDVSNDELKVFTDSLDLDYESYRITKFIKLETLEIELNKFIELKILIDNK